MKIQELAKELHTEPQVLMDLVASQKSEININTNKLNSYAIQYVRELYKKKLASKNNDSAADQEKKIITLDKNKFTLSEFSKLIGKTLSEVMKVVLFKGMPLNLNSEIDFKVAQDIANTLNVDLIFDGVEAKAIKDNQVKQSLNKIEEAELDHASGFSERPPVVTILGHVDHGKTLLLDSIRKSNVIAKEAGGITQHIGAYQIVTKNKKVTFLDTPGHAAFTALRARGAQVTDIVVLVISATEGMMPQTIEALDHAKAAKVPIIVALNKIDLPDANIDRCKQQLAEHDLTPEDWGGKTVVVPISAKTKQGLDELLDMILLTSDMLELQANYDCPAKAVVIESRLSRTKGPLATVLVKTGTLKTGDFFVINTIFGKARMLLNDLGEKITQATPGTPVEILGINEVPAPGTILEVFKNEKEGKVLAQGRKISKKDESLIQRNISFEHLSHQIENGEIHQLNFIIKADVNGSLEAIASLMSKVSNPTVAINLMHVATGPVTENDIMLAAASNALVIGFNVNVSPEAQKIATDEGVNIRTYSIIYEIMDDVTRLISGTFKPVYEEYEIGRAEVRQVFYYSKLGKIAGCLVQSGKITRNIGARLLRNNQEIYKGKVSSLKRFKEDIKEVANGFECGIVLDNDPDTKENDIIVTFGIREKKST